MIKINLKIKIRKIFTIEVDILILISTHWPPYARSLGKTINLKKTGIEKENLKKSKKNLQNNWKNKINKMLMLTLLRINLRFKSKFKNQKKVLIFKKE